MQYQDELTKLPGEINLKKFLEPTLNKATDNLIPVIAKLIDKKLRKMSQVKMASDRGSSKGD